MQHTVAAAPAAAPAIPIVASAPPPAVPMASPASALPRSVKVERPKAFRGDTDDASVLDTFLFAAELYFSLVGLVDVQ